jgi:hypothetical protein
MRIPAFVVIVSLIMGSSPALLGQDGSHTLQSEVRELKSLLEEMKAELILSRAETEAVRKELQQIREQLHTPILPQDAGDAKPLVESLQEQHELLSAKVEEQYQTKVESASKYRVRLSGMVLMNMFKNTGAVDNLDVPTLPVQENSIYSRAGFGGSLRQSLLGLEVIGPEVAGARLSADVRFDFAGGFPNTPDGVTFGLTRVRTGGIYMTWPNTTLMAGQEAPFFSPLSPGSIASLAVPAFSYSGNLWGWIPQLRLEHRLNLADNTNILLQGGILNPLTGELPGSQFVRRAQAGEASGQPAYATRIAWTRSAFGRPMTLGFAGYYSRQDWGFHRTMDSWTATSDWLLPISSRWELSGEFYRGRAIGGLGGGLGHSVVFNGPVTDPNTQIRGVNSLGGWTQIKFQQTEKLEWNGAFGQDNLLTGDFGRFPLANQGYYELSTARNRTSLLNFIYRPRSNLLLSLEYRRLRAFTIRGYSHSADHINMGMGVLF